MYESWQLKIWLKTFKGIWNARNRTIKESEGIKPMAIIFRFMITKPWNVSTNTNVSYYISTHTKAYMKMTNATI